jgi:PKD-like domain/Secretion system C-terminal sorting domain
MKNLIVVLTSFMMLIVLEGKSQSFLSVNHYGSTANDMGRGICTDASGNVYMVGEYNDSITFGTTVLRSSNYKSAFLVKYNASGTVLWAKRFTGTNSGITAAKVRCDNAGNIYVVGTFYGIAKYDTVSTTIGVSGGSTDIFISKINASNGALLWLKSFGSTNGNDLVNSIAVDGSNNLYLTGQFSATCSFGNGITLTSVNNPLMGPSLDCYTVKFNASGIAQWAKSGGSYSDDMGYSVAVDAAGNSYVSGNFLNTATFSGYSLTSSGSVDIFVVGYDPLGNMQLLMKAGSSDYEGSYGITLDGQGYFYITGLHDGPTVFDTITAVPNGSYDMYLAKYSVTGHIQWVNSTISDQWESGTAVVVDSKGNPYVTGNVYHGGTSMFAETNIVGYGYYDPFVVKYNPKGEFQWANHGGSYDYDEPLDMAVADSGKLYISGYYSSSAIFGNNTFNTTGGNDVLLLKLRTDLTTSPITGSVFCAGQPINIPFKSNIPLNAGNVFTAQVSDANGRFTNATNIGSLTSSLTTGIITAIIPDNMPEGNAYRFRIISSDSARLGEDNGANITIHALPAAIISSNGISICGNDSLALISTPIAGNTYKWYNGGTLISGAVSSTYYAKATGTYNAVVTNASGCSRTSNTISVVKTFNVPATPGTISGVARPCPGDTGVTYSIVPVAYATKYAWTVPPGATITSSDTTYTIKVNYSTGFTNSTITVKAINACGSSAAKTKSIYRNIPGIPSVISGPSTGVCSGSTQVYSVGAVNYATTYLWTIPAGITINSGQGTTSITLTFPAGYTSGTISVKAGNSCGFGTARSLTIKSIPPTPATITGPSTVCAQQQGVSFKAAASAGATAYTWIVPSGSTITYGQGTDSIVMKFGAVGGNVKVKAVNVCGTSTAKSKAVIMNCREDGTSAMNDMSVLIYPNPSANTFTINPSFNDNGTYALTIHDVLGRTVASFDKIEIGKEFTFGSEFNDGVYFVEILKDEYRQIVRIIKSH